ncbi:hypothetical protein Dacsa_2643 [Dactylococcopsis salina PCC 8305]|uniref:Uncharacterized protein n=1 Tax=Dactylococcopsis salina (strain PCC 8305) TaxID=13035 RepID=K9YXL2_DACS8|nr:hypothetical protein Dacsa_2643 [Dactylococcopsis salina PCC 8305]
MAMLYGYRLQADAIPIYVTILCYFNNDYHYTSNVVIEVN